MRLLRLGDRMSALRVRLDEKFTLPERFKGTVVEKWTNYWKGLLRDYGEVGTGLVKESYAHPKKALIYGTGGLSIYLTARNNPDEAAFMTLLRQHTNRMVTMPPDQQNREASNYLTMLERAVNQKKLRLLSLGICTLMWVDLHDEDDCTYPAICEYTSVGLLNFHERIIDVGCWNRFWRLDYKMRNYDINYL